jgi:formiminoglutamase
MPSHEPISQSLWAGRSAETIQYWHQAVKCQKPSDKPHGTGKSISLLGYAVDAGVQRNSGRPGSAYGPDAIRKIMAGMGFHLDNWIPIYDFGNIGTVGDDLEETQIWVKEWVLERLQSHSFPLLLGGGHDLAYAHGKAAMEFCLAKGEKLGIINLDAHFDLRPLHLGKGHSGSPFFQLSEEYPRTSTISASVSKEQEIHHNMFETAKARKVQWLDMEDFTVLNWDKIKDYLDHFCSNVNKIYLSIDLDGFSSAFAPGVSAPSPMGFSPELASKVLNWIADSGKLLSMDVVELNPQFDQDNATARLAARCSEQVLYRLFGHQKD